MSKFVSCLEASDPFLVMNMELSMTTESFQVPVTEDLKGVKNFIVERAKKLWDWICEWADKIKEKISEFLKKLPAFKEREIKDLILDPEKLDAVDTIMSNIEKVVNAVAVAKEESKKDVISSGLETLDKAIDYLDAMKEAMRVTKKGSYMQVKKWCLLLQAKVTQIQQRVKITINKLKTAAGKDDRVSVLSFNKQAAALTLIAGVVNHDLSVLRSVSLKEPKNEKDETKEEKTKYSILPVPAK